MRYLILALSVLLAGCVNAPFQGRISSRLPAKCIENIVQAEQLWASRTHHSSVIDLMVTDDESPPGFREIVFLPFPQGKLDGYTHYTMLPTFKVRNATVLLAGECSYQTVAHELGHAFRLSHTHGKNDLMKADGDGFELSARELRKAKRSIGF